MLELSQIQKEAQGYWNDATTCAALTAVPTGYPKTVAPEGTRPPVSAGGRLYRCTECHCRFTPGGDRHYYSEQVKGQALNMYQEGSSIWAIGRVLGVRLGTVYS